MSRRQYDSHDSSIQEKIGAVLRRPAKGNIFLRTQLAYITDVIEFQWRGHPHAHIVYRLQGDALNLDKIDRLITTSYQRTVQDGSRERAREILHDSSL